MNVGDRLQCRSCLHEFEITFEWLRSLCAKKPGGAEKARQDLSKQLNKFKCVSCGAHDVRLIPIEISLRSHRCEKDPTRIDEGIAGTREDNKKIRARNWGDMMKRGR